MVVADVVPGRFLDSALAPLNHGCTVQRRTVREEIFKALKLVQRGLGI